MKEQLDSYQSIEKLLKDENYKDKYHLRLATANPFTTEGVNLFIARKGTHYTDRHIGATIMEFFDYSQINIDEEKIIPKELPVDPDYRGENWLLFKPYVYDNFTSLAEATLIPAQIHINKKIHVYVLDNERVVDNMTLDALEYDGVKNWTRMKTNTYGKLLLLPKLNDTKELILKLQKESEHYYQNDSLQKYPKMHEIDIFKELQHNYEVASEELNFFVKK